MITVYYFDTIVCRQSQIPDFIMPSEIGYVDIYRNRLVNFTRTIEVNMRKRKPAKRLVRKRFKRLHQSKLLRYLKSKNLIVKKKNPKEEMIDEIPNPLSPSVTFTNHSVLLHLPKSYQIKLDIYISLYQLKLKNKNQPSNLDLSDESIHQKGLVDIGENIDTENIQGPFLNTFLYMHLGRFFSIPSVVREDFCNTPYLIKKWKYFQELTDFTGLFQDMIELNSFKYWDTVEKEIRENGFHPKGFSIVEFIKWDFLRLSLGIETASKAERIFREFDTEKLRPAFERPERRPRSYHFSHYQKWLTHEHYHKFFLQLVEECVKFKIIIPRIAIADGLIYRTWAGNFTLDRWMQPTDPQASITRHNNKYLGKCYNAIVFYAWCGNRWLPVDVRVITGSANENSMFQPLVKDFLDNSPYDWDVFLYDSGASSVDNRQFLKAQGIIPGITARKNIKQEVILDLGQKRFCFAADIPDGMSQEQYKRLLNHRSQEEAGFSGFTTYNCMKRMNSMGRDAAIKHVLKYMILQLLHALSAYKVNRPDLIMMYSAFTALT